MTLDIRWFAPAAIVAMVSADCIAVPYMSFAQAQEFIAAPVSLTAEQIQIKNVSAWHSNAAENKEEKFANDYRKKYKDYFYYATSKTALEMLAKAINDSKSTELLKVARTLEGMKYQGDTGEVWMRADDHQLMQAIYISTFTKAVGKDVKYDLEETGYGWKTDVRVEAKDTVMPTTCAMVRP